MLHQADPASTSDLRRPARWLAILAPAAVSLAASLIHGPGFLDDAFITFRFAENLARGRGLVFNPGEPVLGTTTPLFTLVLGALKLAGLDVPGSARAIGVVMTAVTAAIASALALKRTSPLYAGLAGIGLAVQPLLPFIANSGMETGPYLALTFGALLAATERRFRLAGVLCGLAGLTRPDGAVAALVCVGYAAGVERRSIPKLMIPMLAVSLPWIVFAAYYYGSPLPHSMMAKRLTHPEGPLRMLADLIVAFNLSLPMLASTILALIGLAVAAKKRWETLLLAAWTALYLLGLTVTGVKPLHFMWYIAPFAPGVAVFSALGAKALADRLAGGAVTPTPPRLALLGPLALLVIALAHPFTLGSIQRNILRHNRVPQYLKLGAMIAGRALPGDKVLVGEVGAMSYVMMDQYVIDGFGINSPRVRELRLADKRRYLAGRGGDYPEDGTIEWVRAAIEEYQPRYLSAASDFNWLHINELVQEDWFRASYRRVELSDPALDFYPLFERIGHSGEDFNFPPPRVQ